MSEAVIDASVVLAAILQEPGGEALGGVSSRTISAVNYAEARSRLSDVGMSREQVDSALDLLTLSVAEFDADQAIAAADLRGPTRSLGLSLGDRACLALASSLSAVVLTADKVWAKADVPVEIRVVR